MVSSFPCLTRSWMLRALLLKLRGNGDYALQSRDAFTISACRAALEFLPVERHNEFANWLFEKANVYVSNPNQADLMFYNKTRGSLDIYESEIVGTGSTGYESGDLLQTAAVKMYLDQLRGFLEAPATTPFLLVGPAGAAKTLLIEQAVLDMSGYDLVTINCSTQLTPSYIIHVIKQVRWK